MKTILTAILWAVCLFLLVAPALGQEPVPGPVEPVPVVQDDSQYFSGASQTDREIIDLCRQAVTQSDLSFWEKRRAFRIVRRAHFLRILKQDVADEMRFPANPNAAPIVGAIGDGQILDWLKNGGLEQILAFILAIIEALG